MIPGRAKPIRKKRPGTRRGQATRRQTEEVRLAVYGRSGGHCELKISPICIPGVLAWDSPNGSDDVWSRGHLVHLRAKRRFGTNVDICCWGCWHCHLIELHAGGKPCPPKPKREVVQ